MRRIRPPLVIKALLDMKGDSNDTAEPLTLAMLERLEGIVKVRDQLKFNVKGGRLQLVQATFILLIFSGLQARRTNATAPGPSIPSHRAGPIHTISPRRRVPALPKAVH